MLIAALTAAAVVAIPSVRGNRNLVAVAVDASAEPKLADPPTTSWKTPAEIPKLVEDAKKQIGVGYDSGKKDTYWGKMANGFEIDNMGKATHNLVRVHEFWLENTRSWLDLYQKAYRAGLDAKEGQASKYVSNGWPNTKAFDAMKEVVAKIDKVLAGPVFKQDAHKVLDYVHSFVPDVYGSFSTANKGDQVGFQLKFIASFLPNALKAAEKLVALKKAHVDAGDKGPDFTSADVKVKAAAVAGLQAAKTALPAAEAALAALKGLDAHMKALFQGTLTAANDKGDSDPKGVEAEAKKLDGWLKWLSVRLNWYDAKTLAPFPVIDTWQKYCDDLFAASTVDAAPNDAAFKKAAADLA